MSDEEESLMDSEDAKIFSEDDGDPLEMIKAIGESAKKHSEEAPATHINKEEYEEKQNRVAAIAEGLMDLVSLDEEESSASDISNKLSELEQAMAEPIGAQERELNVVSEDKVMEEALAGAVNIIEAKKKEKKKVKATKFREGAWENNLRRLLKVAQKIARRELKLTYVKDVTKKEVTEEGGVKTEKVVVVHKKGDPKLTKTGKEQRALGPKAITSETKRQWYVDKLAALQMAVTARHFTWLGSTRDIPNEWNLNPSFTRLRWQGRPVLYISSSVEKVGKSYVAKLVVHYLPVAEVAVTEITPLPVASVSFTDFDEMKADLTEVPRADLLKSYVSLTDEEKSPSEVKESDSEAAEEAATKAADAAFLEAIDGIGRDFAFLLPDSVPHPTPTLFGSYVNGNDAIHYTAGQGIPFKMLRTADVDYFPMQNDRAWFLLPLDKLMAPYVLSPKRDPYQDLAARRLREFRMRKTGTKGKMDWGTSRRILLENINYANVYVRILQTPASNINERYQTVVTMADNETLQPLRRGVNDKDNAATRAYVALRPDAKKQYVPANFHDIMQRITNNPSLFVSENDEKGDLESYDDQDVANVEAYAIQDITWKLAGTMGREWTVETRKVQEKVMARVDELRTLYMSNPTDFYHNLALKLVRHEYYTGAGLYSKEALELIKPLLEAPYAHEKGSRRVIGSKFEEIVGEFDLEAINLCLARFNALRLTKSQEEILSVWWSDPANWDIYRRLALAPVARIRAAVAKAQQLKFSDTEEAGQIFLRERYCYDDDDVIEAPSTDSAVPKARPTRSRRVYSERMIKGFASVVRDFDKWRKEPATYLDAKDGQNFRKPLKKAISVSDSSSVSEDSSADDDDDVIIESPNDEEFHDFETPLALMVQALNTPEGESEEARVERLANALDAQMIAKRMHFTVIGDNVVADAILNESYGDDRESTALAAYFSGLSEIDDDRLDSIDASIQRLGLKGDDDSYVYEAAYAINPSTGRPDIFFRVLSSDKTTDAGTYLEERPIGEVLKFLTQKSLQGRRTTSALDFFGTKNVEHRIQSDGGYAFLQSREGGGDIYVLYVNNERKENVVVIGGAPGQSSIVVETSATTPALPLPQFAALAHINPEGLPVPDPIESAPDAPKFVDSDAAKKARKEAFYATLKERLKLPDNEGDAAFSKVPGFIAAKAQAEEFLRSRQDQSTLPSLREEVMRTRALSLIKLRLAQGNFIGTPPSALGELGDTLEWAKSFYRPRVNSIVNTLIPGLDATQANQLETLVLERYISSLTERKAILPGMSANVMDSEEEESEMEEEGEEADTSVTSTARVNKKVYAFVCEPDRILWYLDDKYQKVSYDDTAPLPKTEIPGIDLDVKTPRLKSVLVNIADDLREEGPNKKRERPLSLPLGMQILAAATASAASFSGAEWLKGGRRVLLLSPSKLDDLQVLKTIGNMNKTEPLLAIGTMPTLTVFMIVDEDQALIANLRPSGPAFGYPTVQVYVPPAPATKDWRPLIDRWLSPVLKAMQMPTGVFTVTPMGQRGTDDGYDELSDGELFLLDAAIALIDTSITRGMLYDGMLKRVVRVDEAVDIQLDRRDIYRDQASWVELREVLAALPLGMSSFEMDATGKRPIAPPPATKIDLQLHAISPSLLALIVAREQRTLGMVQRVRSLEPYAILDETNRERDTTGLLGRAIRSDAGRSKKGKSRSRSRSKSKGPAKKGKSRSRSRSRSKSKGPAKKGKSRSRSRSKSAGPAKKGRSTSRSRSKSKGPAKKGKSSSRSRSRSKSKGPAKNGKSSSRSRSRSKSKGPSKKGKSSSRSRSRSKSTGPAKKSKSTSRSRSRSKSKEPAKKTKSTSRSRSKSKEPAKKGSEPAKKRSKSASRSKSKEPAKKRDASTSRSPSPAKGKKQAPAEERGRKSTSRSRSRSKDKKQPAPENRGRSRTKEQQQQQDKSTSRSRSRSKDKKQAPAEKRGRSKSRESQDEDVGRGRSRSREQRGGSTKTTVINLPNVQLNRTTSFPQGGQDTVGPYGGGGASPYPYGAPAPLPVPAPIPVLLPSPAPVVVDPAAATRARMEQELLELKMKQQQAKLRETEMRMAAEQERLAQVKIDRTKSEERRLIELREAGIAKERADLDAERLAMNKEVADRIDVLEKKVTPPAAPAPTPPAVLAANRVIRNPSFTEIEEEIWKNSFIY